MATLRTRVRGEKVTVELTVEELHRLLEIRRFSLPRRRMNRTREASQEEAPVVHSGLGTAARVTADLAKAIKDAWPEGVDLVENPELTTGNVRRFLIRKVLKGELTVSTGEVSLQFFKRPLSPSRPQDAADLRRLWYLHPGGEARHRGSSWRALGRCD